MDVGFFRAFLCRSACWLLTLVEKLFVSNVSHRIGSLCQSTRCTRTLVKITPTKRLPWSHTHIWQVPPWLPFIRAGICSLQPILDFATFLRKIRRTGIQIPCARTFLPRHFSRRRAGKGQRTKSPVGKFWDFSSRYKLCLPGYITNVTILHTRGENYSYKYSLCEELLLMSCIPVQNICPEKSGNLFRLEDGNCKCLIQMRFEYQYSFTSWLFHCVMCDDEKKEIGPKNIKTSRQWVKINFFRIACRWRKKTSQPWSCFDRICPGFNNWAILMQR